MKKEGKCKNTMREGNKGSLLFLGGSWESPLSLSRSDHLQCRTLREIWWVKEAKAR